MRCTTGLSRASHLLVSGKRWATARLGHAEVSPVAHLGTKSGNSCKYTRL